VTKLFATTQLEWRMQIIVGMKLIHFLQMSSPHHRNVTTEWYDFMATCSLIASFLCSGNNVGLAQRTCHMPNPLTTDVSGLSCGCWFVTRYQGHLIWQAFVVEMVIIREAWKVKTPCSAAAI